VRHHYALALPLAAALLSATVGFASAAIPGQASVAPANQAVSARTGAAGQSLQLADVERSERPGRDREGEHDHGDRVDRSHR
jgi:hypothetical protein